MKKLHDCFFCNMSPDRIIAENEWGYVIYDGYPVTEKHMLIVPKRHRKTWFDMSASEVSMLNVLIRDMRDMLIDEDMSITGFNIGMNCGESAGQTIMHAHIHLIPRRDGDVAEPRGGVRGVIPGKASY